MNPLRIGVLASGGGTTLQAIIDACEGGSINAKIVTVISNNSQSGAANRARNHDLPLVHLSGQTHPGPDQPDQVICAQLASAGAELVMLAGYMKKLGARTLETFKGRILNTHPALLPRFGGQGMYGNRVHQAVLDAGETVTGITIHHVDAEYDAGPQFAQVEVPVEPGDTVDSLADRVQARERLFLVETLGEIAAGERTLG
jgi:phosphoribosylglycinamide formyltransferase-1